MKNFYLSLFLIIVISGVVLYRSPYSTSNLDVVPDSVEYAIAASRIERKGPII